MINKYDIRVSTHLSVIHRELIFFYLARVITWLDAPRVSKGDVINSIPFADEIYRPHPFDTSSFFFFFYLILPSFALVFLASLPRGTTLPTRKLVVRVAACATICDLWPMRFLFLLSVRKTCSNGLTLSPVCRGHRGYPTDRRGYHSTQVELSPFPNHQRLGTVHRQSHSLWNFEIELLYWMIRGLVLW